MSDEANAGSNPAPSDVAQVDAGQAVQPEAQASQVQAKQPEPVKQPTAREALEKAFNGVAESQDKGGRERGPDGKFVAKQAEAPKQVTTGQNTADALAAEQAAQEAAKVAPAPVAHPGLTKEAQALWNAAPEGLRNDVMRRVTELTQGMEQHKAAADQVKAAFEPIRKFDDMAKQSGRTLDAVLTDYVGIENMITQNPLQGVLQICRNMNINPQALGQALAGLTPQQMAQVPQQQQQPQTPAELKAIQDRLDRMEQAQKAQTVEATVSNFASEKDADGAMKHPYFDELSTSIAEMLETGFAKNLSDAYDKAVRLNPEIAARIEQDKAAKAAKPNQPDPAQTQDKAKKSITGSPSSASNASTRKPAGSAREALQNAFAQVGI